jgi:hypothetical protein
MSKAEVIEQITNLPTEDQREIFTFLASKVLTEKTGEKKPWAGKKLSFEEACDVVFRENRDLLNLLAK